MINTAYFLALFLVFVRLTSFFVVSTVFYPKGTPNVFKIALAMIISYFITNTIDSSIVLIRTNNEELRDDSLFQKRSRGVGARLLSVGSRCIRNRDV